MIKKSKTGRRSDREHVFRMLFTLEFCENPSAQAVYDGYVSSFCENKEGEESPDELPSIESADFVLRELSGVITLLDEIDGLIGKFSESWEVSRMPITDISIMRLAVYEILCEPDIPVSVSINEAVELAKLYGGDNSPAFVNGILGRFEKNIKNVPGI